MASDWASVSEPVESDPWAAVSEPVQADWDSVSEPVESGPTLGQRALMAARGVPGVGPLLSLTAGSQEGLLDEEGKRRFAESEYRRAEQGLEASRKVLEAVPGRIDRAHTPSEARVAAAQEPRLRERVGEAEERLTGAVDIAEGLAPGAEMTAGRSAAAGAVQRFGQGLTGDLMKSGAAVLQSGVIPGTIRLHESAEDTPLYQAGERVNRAIAEAFPTDPARAERFEQQLGEGAGSMASFMAPAVGMQAAGARAGARITPAVLGAAQQGIEGYDDAARFTEDENTRLASYWLNAGLGTSEALPMTRVLARLEGMSGGSVSRILKGAAQSSAEEFLQEVGQAVGSDMIARAVYDEEREVGEGALRQGAIGAILGAFAGAGSGVAARPVTQDQETGFEEVSDPVAPEVQQEAQEATQGEAAQEGAVETPPPQEPPVAEPEADIAAMAAAPRPETARPATEQPPPQVTEDATPRPPAEVVATEQRAMPLIKGLENQRTRPEAGIARSDDADMEVSDVQKIVALERRLVEALGLTARTGQVPLRKALGTYNRKTGVIRRRASVGNEIEVLTHEAGHALEFNPTVAEALRAKLPKALDSYKAELEPLAYKGVAPGAERSEGFAEFLRYYVTNPEHARSQAPNFYREFETVMEAADPKALKALRDIRDAWQGYLEAPSVEAAKAHIVSRGDRGRDSTAMARALEPRNVYTAYDRIYRETVDKHHAVKKAVEEMAKAGAAPKGMSDNPYDLRMIADHAAQMAGADLKYGVMTYDRTGRGEASVARALEEAFSGRKPSQREIEDFDAYLALRRVKEDYRRMAEGKQDKPFGMELGDVNQAVADLEAKHPAFRDASETYNQYQRDSLRLLHDAGLLSNQDYEAIDQARAFYAPAYRASKAYEGLGAASMGDNRSRALKRARGSQRSIVSPLEMTGVLAAAARRKVEHNRVLLSMKALAERTGAGGAIFEPLPAQEAKKLRVDTKAALDSALKDLDVDPETEKALAAIFDGLEVVNGKFDLWTQQEATYKGRPVVWVWEGGERTPYLLPEGQFGQDLYASLALQGGRDDGPLVKFAEAFLYYPTLAVRNTVTMHPAFVFANLMRDQLGAALVARGKFIPFGSAAKGAYSFASNSRARKEYEALGGIMGGQLASATAPKSAERLIRSLTPKKGRGSLMHGLAMASEWSELATRIGAYEHAKAEALKRGLSEEEARVDAVRTANDLIDFSRHGASGAMTFARRAVPFLNPWVQGLDKQARSVVPGARAWAKHSKGQALNAAERRQMEAFNRYAFGFTLLSLAGLMIAAQYADDEEYQEFTEYERARHWIFRLPNGNWFFYPKPFEHAVGSSLLERAWERIAEDDPNAAESFGKDLAELYGPPGIVPVLPKILAEQWGNKNFFTGAPIVPSGTESLQPIDQYNDYTAPWLVDAAAKLEEVTGIQVSPARAQHILTSLTTSWGRDAISVSRAMSGEMPDASDTPIAQRFVKKFHRSSMTDRRFWADMAENGDLRQTERSFKAAVRDNGPAAGLRVLNRTSVDQRAREFAVSQAVYEGYQARIHPMRWADEMRKVVQAEQRAVRDNRALSAAQRQALTDEMGALMLWQKRAAMTLTEHEAYPADQLPEVEARMVDALLSIAAASPQTFDRLQSEMLAGYAGGGRKYPTYDQMKSRWPQMRSEISSLLNDPERLSLRLAD